MFPGRKAVKTAAMAVLAACAAACSTPAPRAGLAAALEAELEAIRAEHDYPGMTLAMLTTEGDLTAVAVGKADLEQDVAMTPAHLMPAGSAGKSFVAAATLALVEEGALSLDGKISQWLSGRKWFSGVPNGEDLTLRMLLNHSSGVADDYISGTPLENAFAYSLDAYGGKDLSEQGITHDDFGAAVAMLEPAFPAGTGYAYSDSNYILIGLIIETVTGNDYYDEVRRRFLEPLGLTGVIPSRRIVDGMASGYELSEDRFSFLPRKVSENGRLIMDPAIEWTGGGFIASAPDLARWARAYYGGAAIAGDYVDEIIASANVHGAPDAGYRYGLGAQIAESDAYGLRLHHGGYFFGYSTFMEYLPKYGAALAFQINAKEGYNTYRNFADRLWAVYFKTQEQN